MAARIEGPDVVINHPYFHPGTGTFDEDVAQTAAKRVGSNNIELQIYILPCMAQVVEKFLEE